MAGKGKLAKAFVRGGFCLQGKKVGGAAGRWQKCPRRRRRWHGRAGRGRWKNARGGAAVGGRGGAVHSSDKREGYELVE